jgi:hypothetical protein
MAEDKAQETQAKEPWVTPELVVHGDAKKITQHIPSKVYGASDGATWNGQTVAWGGS